MRMRRQRANRKKVRKKGEDGREGDAVQVKCMKCKNIAWSFGEGVNSTRRSLAMLRESCPKGERNWYVCKGDGGSKEITG